MRQAEKREETRRNVLRAAHAVFGQRGYHDATLREIADAAGVSKGAVYYNFATKEELFLGLLQARMEERLAAIRAAQAAHDPASDPIGRAAGDYIDNIRRNQEWVALFLEFLARAARDDRFAAEIAARFRTFWAELADLLERGADAQGLRLPLPPEQLAIAIDVLAIGFMIPQVIGADEVPEDLLAKAIGYMLSGVAQAARDDGAPRD